MPRTACTTSCENPPTHYLPALGALGDSNSAHVLQVAAAVKANTFLSGRSHKQICDGGFASSRRPTGSQSPCPD